MHEHATRLPPEVWRYQNARRLASQITEIVSVHHVEYDRAGRGLYGVCGREVDVDAPYEAASSQAVGDPLRSRYHGCCEAEGTGGSDRLTAQQRV